MESTPQPSCRTLPSAWADGTDGIIGRTVRPVPIAVAGSPIEAASPDRQQPMCYLRWFFKEAVLMIELPKRHATSLEGAAGLLTMCYLLEASPLPL